MSGALKTHLDRLKADMAADKKKTGILAALSLILLIAVGRLLLPGEAPSTASADTLVVANNAALPRTDNALTPARPTTSGAPPVAVVPQRSTPNVPMPQSAQSSGKKTSTIPAPFVKSMTQAPAVNADVVSHLPRTLERNPFDATDWRRRFRVPSEPTDTPVEPGRAASLFTALADSLATYQTERAELTERLDEELAELELRSTMTGSRRSAYISGQLLHEGDEIAGFSVVRIEAGRVVLSKYGIRRTLSVP